MVVYLPLQTICVNPILGREVIIYGIASYQGGPIMSLFDKINFTPPPSPLF